MLPVFGGLAAQVDSLGLGVGVHPALSLSSNKPAVNSPTSVNPAKKEEPIETPFGELETRVDPRSNVINGCRMKPPHEYDWTIHAR